MSDNETISQQENEQLLLENAHLHRLVIINKRLAELRLKRIEQLQAKITELLAENQS